MSPDATWAASRSRCRQRWRSGPRCRPGVFPDFGGQFENQQRAMARLKIVVPLSIALIAMLLYATLGSWTLAALVLANLPFPAVGGIAALWLRGLHLSVSASIGFIALFGVAVLNGLVLLTTVQRRRQEGVSAADAPMAGSRERLRPVLMTATVASIGFIPRRALARYRRRGATPARHGGDRRAGDLHAAHAARAAVALRLDRGAAGAESGDPTD